MTWINRRKAIFGWPGNSRMTWRAVRDTNESGKNTALPETSGRERGGFSSTPGVQSGQEAMYGDSESPRLHGSRQDTSFLPCAKVVPDDGVASMGRNSHSAIPHIQHTPLLRWLLTLDNESNIGTGKSHLYHLSLTSPDHPPLTTSFLTWPCRNQAGKSCNRGLGHKEETKECFVSSLW